MTTQTNIADVLAPLPGPQNFFKIGDTVWFDADGDGRLDANEEGVSGVLVTLTGAGEDGQFGTADDYTATYTTGDLLITNDGKEVDLGPGGYRFDNLTPGEYQLKFDLPDGYAFTIQDAPGTKEFNDSDVDPETGLITGLTLVDGDTTPKILTADAGLIYKTTASLGDRVWFDTNGNGIQDDGEAGVEGVTVRLTSPDLSNAFEMTTDADGNYKFEDLAPGEYQVQIVTDTLPEGYELTTPNQGGDDALDSDANPANGLMASTTLSAGENDMSHDAGIVAKPASLGDRVWYDTDRDGIQDAGEKGVKGAKVILTGGGADGVIGTADDTTATTTTDGNGNYRFDNLNAGEEYKVTFSTPESNGIENLIENGSFEQNNTAQNRWRVESGIKGWKVTQGRGIEVQELYQHFGAGDEGQSWVEMDGYENTGILQNVDTQAGQGYELSFVYAPRPGVSAESNALEVYWNGELIDTISESGIGQRNSQWKTYTYEVEGSEKATTGLEFRGAGRSDGLGAFLDDVQLVTSANSAPAGLGNELKGGATVDGWRSNLVVNESDIYTNQSGLTQTISLSNFDFNAAKTGAPVTPFVALVNGDNDFTVLEVGTSRTDYSLGNNSFAFIDGAAPEVTLEAGQKLAIGFLDSNADGTDSQQSAVRFSYGGDEIWYSGGWATSHAAKVEAGAAPTQGHRTLTHLKRDYQFGIDFEVETDSLFEFTQQNVGDDAFDSDANRANGMSQTVTLSPGEYNSTIDAGIVEQLGTVGGQVWHDRHPNDGIQNVNDLNYEAGGFSNVLVKLHNQEGTVVDSTLTTTAGFYHFDEVGSGSYYVSFDSSTNLTTKSKLDGTTQFSGVPAQRGWRYTAVFNAGTDDAIDSDIISGTSTGVAQRTGTFNLYSGEVNKTIDTAITPITFDLNGDGIQTLSINEGVEFDMLNTGTAVNTGWVSGDDGFLAIDNNGDGLISSRAELFGGATVGSGFAKLESFDSNGDGLVNGQDAQFAELKLWQDANENGFTDKGELMSLEAAGISDLSLDYTNVFSKDANGNIHGEVSSAVKNGSTIEMTDVYFQVAV